MSHKRVEALSNSSHQQPSNSGDEENSNDSSSASTVKPPRVTRSGKASVKPSATNESPMTDVKLDLECQTYSPLSNTPVKSPPVDDKDDSAAVKVENKVDNLSKSEPSEVKSEPPIEAEEGSNMSQPKTEKTSVIVVESNGKEQKTEKDSATSPLGPNKISSSSTILESQTHHHPQLGSSSSPGVAVNGDRTGGKTSSNGNSSTTTSTTTSISGTTKSNKSLSSSDNSIRIGPGFQASLNECDLATPPEERYKTKDPEEECTCVWRPPTDEDLTVVKIDFNDINDFLAECRANYDYTEEQALGILFLHCFDSKEAINDVSSYSPSKNQWSTEEKVLFDQAFALHGKFFARIKQMIPNKTMGSLVDYYYSWKKRRNYSSTTSSSSSASSTSNFAEKYQEQQASRIEDEDARNQQNLSAYRRCQHCQSYSGKPVAHDQFGNLCQPCALYYKRTGSKRSEAADDTNETSQRDSTTNVGGGLSVCREPSVINLSYHSLSNNNSGRSCGLKTPTKRRLSSSDHQQTNKSTKLPKLSSSLMDQYLALSAARKAAAESPSYINSKSSQKNSFLWSHRDHDNAMKGFRKFGKDYESISKLVATKSADQIKTFYKDYCSRWNLDKLVEDYEADRKRAKEERAKEKAEKKNNELLTQATTSHTANNDSSTQEAIATA